MSLASSKLKRKSSPPQAPVSSRAKTRKGKPDPVVPSLWGDKVEDLRLVRISVNEPLFTHTRDLYQFRDVSYTEHKTGEQIEANIESGRSSSLVIEESLKTDLNRKLGPVIQKLKPLENITTYQQHDVHHKTRWGWKKNLGTPQMEPLCRDFFRALRYSMEDTDGKHAMKALLEEIVTRLDRRATLISIATGSAKATHYACLVKMKYVRVPSPVSSSSSECSKEYVNYNVLSKTDKSPLTLRSSIQKKTPKPTDSGLSSTDEHEEPHPKRRTSDVLVFSHKSDYEPIVANLVVSIRSGTVVDPRGIAKELLGRLPYQSDVIYGLEINQLQAVLYSVEKCDGGSAPIVKLQSYPEYFFLKDYEFDLNTFKKMVLDIGFILMVDQDHP